MDTSVYEEILDQDMLNKLKSMRLLTKEEKEEICDLFKIPYNGIDIVLETANKNIKKIAMDELEDVIIFPEAFDEFKDHLQKKFEFSLIEAKAPIGMIAGDAIGQQSMQAVLNTFHNVGNASAGGPEGIRENISISKERKNPYSRLCFRNPFLKYNEVMKLAPQFIGASIDFLLAEKASSKIINIPKVLSFNIASSPPPSKEDFDKAVKNDVPWWYVFNDLSPIYNQNTVESHVRKCVRLKFDLQKLYEFNLTLFEVAKFINTWVFKVTQPKRSADGSLDGTKRKTSTHGIYAIPSPTALGIIDVFMKNYSNETDYILINILHKNDFAEMFISGIEGIKNFYAINTSVTRLFKNIVSTSVDEEKDGIIGTWIYLDDSRFYTMPYCRAIYALEKSGLKFEFPSYGTPLSFKDSTGKDIIYTDINFEFHSHKIVKELRKEMRIRAYIHGSFTEHKEFSYYMPMISNGMYTNQLQLITPKNDHYSYEKVQEGKEYVLLYYNQGTELFAGIPLFKTKLKSAKALTDLIKKSDNRITHSVFLSQFINEDTDSNVKTAYDTFFNTDSIPFAYLGFEINENDSNYYVYYLIVLHKYIDYKIDVNLDYCNSHLVTQSLQSMLEQQFKIPAEYFTNQIIPYCNLLSNFKILSEKKVEEPQRRILLKSKVFLTDRYDFLGEDDREQKKKDKKTKLEPLGRFMQYISENVDPEYLEYVYAETIGSNLSKILPHKLLRSNSTFSNHYYQTLGILGIEAMRNLLTYDMINMINNSGYINVSYINLQTNVTTHNGPNPMTSNGISCQKRGVHDMITFDNAGHFILSGAFKGKKEYTNNTSTAIFIGNMVKIGTTATSVSLDRLALIANNKKNNISDGFLKLASDSSAITTLFLPDLSEKPIIIPPLDIGKFPSVPFVISNFVRKDLYFFIKSGIDNDKIFLFKTMSINKPKTASFKLTSILRKIVRIEKPNK